MVYLLGKYGKQRGVDVNAAVITGASSGMGREFVLQLAQKERFDEI